MTTDLTALKGLYIITDPTLSPGTQLLSDVEDALKGGAQIVQYRDKLSNNIDKLANAKYLQSLCQHYGVPLIINDDIALAKHIGADGVHLGKDDTDLATARQQLGKHAIIGVSCYNDLQLAQQLVSQGANYVAFGRFFPSHTKPNAPAATLNTLRQAKQQLPVPIVAIGGITPHNAPLLLDAGADALAVIHAIFGQANKQLAAQQLQNLILQHKQHPNKHKK